jgi:hypothetical protein
MPSAPLTAVPQESAPASPVAEVFTPSNAPHLRRIATDIETQLARIETLPTDVLRRLLRVGTEIARARDEYERFRRRLGVHRKADGGSDS